MKIAVYSTNTNIFNNENFLIKTLPTCAQNFTKSIKKYTSLDLFLFSHEPATFLFDIQDNKIQYQAEKVHYKIITSKNAEEIASELAVIKPDLAIAASFWENPFDWLPLQDSFIGEILTSMGIQTIFHPLETSLICFNKNRTKEFLQKNHFNHANSIYIHHELFRIERSRPEILNNTYQEIVLHKVSKLKYPVIIKDTLSLSSYGMDVCTSFGMAKNILLSKKNSGDRLAEEFLDGPQFGTEIHGQPGNYTIYPPFLFSTNQYGITSPKQSVKLGPVTNEKYKLNELYQNLNQLAETLELRGIAQVDLVFHNKKWYIIEINPRLSGLSPAIACSCGKTIPDLILEAGLNKNSKNPEMKLVVDIKFPILSEEKIQELYQFESILYIRQMNNKDARQHREEGFCQVIFGYRNSPEEIKKDLIKIKSSFPEIMETAFYQKALSMLSEI